MKDYSKLKKIVAHNERQMDEADGDQGNAKNLITFVDEATDTDVYNPFEDVTGRFEVDPIEEYGESKLQEMINKYNEMVS